MSCRCGFKSHKPFEPPPAITLKGLERMNTHELRTWAEKAETELETNLRKAEKNLRFSAQTETKTAFTNDLRQFSAKNKNSLKQPPHTTLVDSADHQFSSLFRLRTEPVRTSLHHAAT